MIESGFFFNFLKKNKIDFFCGVPDSVLKAADSQLSKLKKKIILSVTMKAGRLQQL